MATRRCGNPQPHAKHHTGREEWGQAGHGGFMDDIWCPGVMSKARQAAEEPTVADEYTPTTEQVRGHFAASPMAPSPREFARGAFDRWLAARDREVAAKALRDAAQIVQDTARQGGGLQTAEGALRAEADRIESQANEKGAGDVR